MRSRLFCALILALALSFSAGGFSQDKPDGNEKVIQWVDIRVPRFPPLARQARILGMVAIEVRFKGCEPDPASAHVVSGHAMLAPAALESFQKSVLRCGDFPDSNATLYYEFGTYERPGCENSGYPGVEVAGNHVRVLTTAPCVEQ